MKYYFLLFLTFLTIKAEAQIDSIRTKIEKFIPLYIVDNYCNKMGFINIMREIKSDDRIGDILFEKSNSVLADSIFSMEYNNTVIQFMRHSNVPYLEIFNIYFRNANDIHEFKRLYFKVLDPKGTKMGDNKMNNVLISDEKELPGYPFVAICFVYQWDFCNKNN